MCRVIDLRHYETTHRIICVDEIGDLYSFWLCNFKLDKVLLNYNIGSQFEFDIGTYCLQIVENGYITYGS